MIEAGSKVNWSVLESGVADKIFFYYAPKILGGMQSLPVAGGAGRAKRRDAIRVRDLKLHPIAADEFAVEAWIDRGRAEPMERQFLERVRDAIEVLERIATDRSVLEPVSAADRDRLHRAVAEIYHPDSAARRRRLKARERERSASQKQRADATLHETGIRTLRRKPAFTTPNFFPPEGFEPRDVPSDEPQHCYVCKEKYSLIHHFYDQLCPSCAEFNFRKRAELADLRGRVALLTGGRVKIGYQAGIKLLRSGADLIVTTRFPRDSAERYAREPDFEQWGHRLEIFGLDLRHTPSVEAFCQHLLRRARGWISSSTTPARPCAVRRIFTRT